jgi:hypothetical protein
MAYEILKKKLGVDLAEYITDFITPSKNECAIKYNRVLDELLFNFALKKLDYYMVLDTGTYPIVFHIYHRRSLRLL